MTNTFRKLTFALGAATVVAAAALSPTAASAAPHWGHGHHGRHGGYGFGIYAPTYVAGPDCYVVQRVVYTPYGKRFRNVTVCD